MKTTALGLVRRHGGFSLRVVSSFLFGLPLIIWAETIDFIPGSYILFYLGLLMVPVWLMIALALSNLQGQVEWEEGVKRARLDMRQMSESERRWVLAFVFFALSLIGWLNAVLTINLGALWPGLLSFQFSSWGVWLLLLGFPILAVLSILYSLRGYRTAYNERLENPPKVILRNGKKVKMVIPSSVGAFPNSNLNTNIQ